MNISIKTNQEPILTIRLKSFDIKTIGDEIIDLKKKNKDIFKLSATILEISDDIKLKANELAVFIELLNQNSLNCIGIRSNTKELIEFAKLSGLAIFAYDIKAAKSSSKDKKQNKEDINKIALTNKKTSALVIYETVRNGQQVFAKKSDLVLLNNIYKGAEVIACGSVYAYKTVQGSVFAGVNGDKKAAIYINKFATYLVSIAGIYRKFAKIPTEFLNKSVYISLDKQKLNFHIIDNNK